MRRRPLRFAFGFLLALRFYGLGKLVRLWCLWLWQVCNRLTRLFHHRFIKFGSKKKATKWCGGRCSSFPSTPLEYTALGDRSAGEHVASRPDMSAGEAPSTSIFNVEVDVNVFKPRRSRLIANGFGGRSRIALPPRRRPQKVSPMTINESSAMLLVTTPRSPTPGGQLSPSFPPSNQMLPPIRKAGMPSRASPAANRPRQSLSPYATAPLGVLPQLPYQQPHAGAPHSPSARYASPRGSPGRSPSRMMRSSPPSLELSPGSLQSKRMGTRSRGERLGLDDSAQHVSYARISSPAKLHHAGEKGASMHICPPQHRGRRIEVGG